MSIVDPNLLVVGIGSKSDALRGLPSRLFVTATGAQASRCLRENKVDMVISRWQLADMPDGMFLQRIIAAKPAMRTIVLIRPNDHKQEAAARSLGVSVVLNEDIDDEHFRETVCQLLVICPVTVEQNNRWSQCSNF